MMRRSRFVLAALGALLALARPYAGAAVKVERVEYRGWKECWKLSNGTVELVFVPSIGRIMHYGRLGSPNVLWVNPTMAGKLPVETKDWQNFGGDKLWPAPQTIWGWPPDPALDPGKHEVKELPGGRLLITGAPSEKSGVRFEREIAMDLRGVGVRIVNRMINSSAKPQKWAVWEIAQVDEPEFAMIPRSESAAHAKGYYPFPDNAPDEDRLTLTPQAVVIRRNPAKGAKVGSYSAKSRAASHKARFRFTITVEESAAPAELYPHGGGRQEIWTNGDPDKYVELELLGPIKELQPGERAHLVTRWTLTPVVRGEETEFEPKPRR